MATPSRSVQCREIDQVVQMYKNQKVPAFGIKQNSALNFKYQGEDLDQGALQLQAFLEFLADSQSSAIYTLAVYEDFDGRITEKTPPDLSFNFRLRDDYPISKMGEMYGGNYGQVLQELKEVKAKLAAIEKAPEDENRLGIIGELMEMEPLQPMLMAIGNKVADWILKDQKVGELKRVSGIPGHGGGMSEPWRQNALLAEALDTLSEHVPDLPDVMKRLAVMSREKPSKFNLYLSMIRKL